MSVWVPEARLVPNETDFMTMASMRTRSMSGIIACKSLFNDRGIGRVPTRALECQEAAEHQKMVEAEKDWRGGSHGVLG